MQRLANFSIETDSIVLLYFQNGQEQRVAVSQLPEHLFEPDLRRVHAAMRLRHDFIKTHLPKMGLVLLAVLSLATVVVGGQKAVAQFLNKPAAPVVAPPHDSITHMAPPNTPAGTAAAPHPSTPDQQALAPAPAPRRTLSETIHQKASSSTPVRKAQSQINPSGPAVRNVSANVTIPALPLTTANPDAIVGHVADRLSLPLINKDSLEQGVPVLQTPIITPAPDSNQSTTPEPSTTTQ